MIKRLTREQLLIRENRRRLCHKTSIYWLLLLCLMIKVLMEFEHELEMNQALEKMGMEVIIKFQPIQDDDIDYLVQMKNLDD